MRTRILPRERHKEIMRLKKRGLLQSQIAGQLHIYESAVFHHLKGLCKCVNGAEADAAAEPSGAADVSG